MSLETKITDLVLEIRNRGTSDATYLTPGYVGYDFQSGVLGDPLFEGTMWLPDDDESDAWAHSVLRRMADLGVRAVEENYPYANISGWTNPLVEARTPYAYLVYTAWGEEGADEKYGTVIMSVTGDITAD